MVFVRRRSRSRCNRSPGDAGHAVRGVEILAMDRSDEVVPAADVTGSGRAQNARSLEGDVIMSGPTWSHVVSPCAKG